MREKKIFIFDLDGTLVDAYRAIHKSLVYTRKKLGLNLVSFEEVKRSVGRGDIHFIEHFFPQKKHQKKALEIYRKYHKQSLKKYTYLKPYAKRLLRYLKKKNKITAIASNRPALYTDIIVKALRIEKLLDYVLCADQIKSLKPNPKILLRILKKFKLKKAQALYAGDMDIDMETAKRAKIDAVFIVGGSSALKDVRQYKNKKVAYSLREVVKLYC